MPFQKLSHYSIRTTDIDASRKFYTEVLSFTVGPRPPFNFPGLWLYNGSHDLYDNAIVHIIGVDATGESGVKDYLGHRAEQTLQGSTGAFDHIAFSMTGLDGMLKHLKKKKVEYRERKVPKLNLHQVFLDDPNGVVIELNYPAQETAAA